MKITTNTKIAELLLAQTYAERMGMATRFVDVIHDWNTPGMPDDMASLLQGWAENQLETLEE